MKYISLLILLSGAYISFGQTHRDSLKLEEKRRVKFMRQIERNKDEYQDCVFTGKIPAKERQKIYPFNVSKKILIISFDNEVEDKFWNQLPIENGVIDFSKVNEQIELTEIQIDSLTNLLYNTAYRKNSPHALSTSGCYEPRNAILFYNDSSLVEYLEICFHCSGFKSSSKEIDLGIDCNQKYLLLKQFFITTGIKTGTINN